MTNLVAYRGHQNPVWDVKWSPMGVYFATASRDRTARLWSTDRTTALRIYAGHLSDVDVSSSACSRGLLLKTLTVPELPSKLVVSGDGIKRLDGSTVGRPTRVVREGVHRAPGGSVYTCCQP